MSSEPTVIYSAASLQQAYLLRGLLEERGIKALVVNDAIQIAGGELPIGWTAAPQVVVAQEHADAARRLARELDQPDRRHPAELEPARGELVAEWPDWPRCPTCATKRSARCPICETTGVQFPLADYQADENGQRVLLVCATCDDHMRPEWYRLCPQCGYDFGDGIGARPPSFPTVALDPVFAWLLAAVVLTTAASAAYFWWLFR